jgi:hypothetical protein
MADLTGFLLCSDGFRGAPTCFVVLRRVSWCSDVFRGAPTCFVVLRRVNPSVSLYFILRQEVRLAGQVGQEALLVSVVSGVL